MKEMTPEERYDLNQNRGSAGSILKTGRLKITTMKLCLLTMGRKIIIINTIALAAALHGKVKVYCPFWA